MSFVVLKRFLRRASEKELPRKNTRYDGAFRGEASGDWHLGGYLGKSDWEAAMGMSSRNQGRNLMVEGATEFHPGFLKALHEMVREYPELKEFEIKFDGPWQRVTDVLRNKSETVNWHAMVFYHGTSSWAADRILREGLKPRAVTNLTPVYGAGAGAHSGRMDAVYLTTQLSMARFAAMEAARLHHGDPVILEVRNIDGDKTAADEDSGEQDAARSLHKLGSIAYLGSIPARSIKLVSRMVGQNWVDE